MMQVQFSAEAWARAASRVLRSTSCAERRFSNLDLLERQWRARGGEWVERADALRRMERASAET